MEDVGVGPAQGPLLQVLAARRAGHQDAADVRRHPRGQALGGGGALQRRHPFALSQWCSLPACGRVAHDPPPDLPAISGAAGSAQMLLELNNAQRNGRCPTSHRSSPRGASVSSTNGRAARAERSDLVAQPYVLPHLQRARPPRPDAPRRRPRRPRGGVPRDGVDRRPIGARRAAPRAARDVHQHHREARVGLERPRAHRPRRRLREDPRAGARVRPDAVPSEGGFSPPSTRPTSSLSAKDKATPTKCEPNSTSPPPPMAAPRRRRGRVAAAGAPESRWR